MSQPKSETFYPLPNRRSRRQKGKVKARLREALPQHPLKRGEWSQQPSGRIDDLFEGGGDDA